VLVLASFGRQPLDIATLGAAAALSYSLAAWGATRQGSARTPGASPLAFRPTHPGLLLAGVGLGLSLKLPAESIRGLTERYFPSPEQALLHKTILYGTRDLQQVITLILVVCLVAPLVEEVFFRGALFGRLSRYSVRLAAGVSGLLFVLAHDDARDWPALTMVAAALSLLRALGGSLLPCLGLHVAFNSAGVLALVTGKASVTSPLEVPIGVVASSWLAVALLVLLVQRLATAPEVARARAQDVS
jgi:membrane protease YdiL (CAAX protease family)